MGYIMTVQELINKLSTLDPNRRVIIQGYEGGYEDVGFISERSIKLNVNKSWYYGPHAGVDSDTDADEVAYLMK